MWIDNKNFPPEAGYYICLIDLDGFGNLIEIPYQLFDGKDWSHTHSSRQFIRYWKATQEQYNQISTRTEKEYDEYLESKLNNIELNEL